jgi:MFS family permease
MRLFPGRSRAWLARWQPVLPLFAAEFVVWVGFGALLPVLPLYFRDHGVDLALLGLVVAAWPAARLLAEPAFGWVADRTARMPLLVVGLLGTGVAVFLPLVFVGPIAFLALRAVAGLFSAMYDPAARGFLVDETPPDRRGEAFGLYGAAQMGGLLLGPAIGGLGAAVSGRIEFVFVFCALAAFVAAAAIRIGVHESGPRRAGSHWPAPGVAGLPTDEPVVHGRSAPKVDLPSEGIPPSPSTNASGHAASTAAAPTAAAPTAAVMSDPGLDGRSGSGSPERRRPPASLWNRLFLAALAIQVGGFYASGTYEVVWSLYLVHLGAGLDLIGLTFAMFGLPILLLSPYGGRLIDRRGPLPFIVAGGLTAAACGILYTIAQDPRLFVPIVLLEAAGFAFLTPAVYAVVAAGSPAGRSSTAQGIFGAAGTVGTIVASVTAGWLAGVDLRLPFWVFSAVMLASLALTLVVGWSALRRLDPGSSSGASGRPERLATV